MRYLQTVTNNNPNKQTGPPWASCKGVYIKHTPVTRLCSVETRAGALSGKQWRSRRGISMTDGYWLCDTVICFCAVAQLISHKETRETLLDYYSERLSVSLHWIPHLVHLSFYLSLSLRNILVIFNNVAGWYGGVSGPHPIFHIHG